ncbi:DUF4272 domain-containing protein [Aquisalimonas lutea]|uniref:DUF4272 domain-containing protein n=1 Tax=Aquisalimonas lutea TaxID=1327750 RepID=UPI0025B5C8CB|nr:DUF4272 domain-containing protein [Aquisalimonas lutea]MDN3516372.1 DUF4272 domain-containing protein [Aquisalimonas lutea]
METAQRLGYRTNPNLPLLDPIQSIRPKEELLDRILALYTCVSSAFDFPKETALSWLRQEGLYEELSPFEREYLKSNDESERATFAWQVEALWALTWVSGHHDSLDFSDSCADDFVYIFPRIRPEDTTRKFRNVASPRRIEDVVEMLDLSYCLDWAVMDARLRGAPEPGEVPGLVVQERRRALEWVAGEDPWDEITLDT